MVITKSRPSPSKPSSLLERQKIERRRAVLDAAKELIKQHGYEQTTMEGLAQHAGLSTQTVYNYFGTKLDVLMELYTEDRDIAHRKLCVLLEAGADDPLELFMQVLTADLHQEVDAVNHALWRQVASAELIHTQGKHFETFERMNQRYRLTISKLIRTFVVSGQLNSDLDVSSATELFLHLSEGFYRKLISTDEATFASLRKDARKQLSLLLKSFTVE
jgi:AcrR family transcriptional regulator